MAWPSAAEEAPEPAGGPAPPRPLVSEAPRGHLEGGRIHGGQRAPLPLVEPGPGRFLEGAGEEAPPEELVDVEPGEHCLEARARHAAADVQRPRPASSARRARSSSSRIAAMAGYSPSRSRMTVRGWRARPATFSRRA